jgi:hypothetical protein
MTQQKQQQEQAPQPQQQQQQQEQQRAQQLQHKSKSEFSRHSALIAVSIASLARQLGDLAALEEDPKRQRMLRKHSDEIIESAMALTRPEGLYITVPPDWEPPTMFEPCPNCTHMRSKQTKK